MFGYLGGFIATWTHLPGDSPLHLVCATLLTSIAIGTGMWMNYDDKRLDEKEAVAHEELLGAMQKGIQELAWKHSEWR
jgi:hypothetical protein